MAKCEKCEKVKLELKVCQAANAQNGKAVESLSKELKAANGKLAQREKVIAQQSQTIADLKNRNAVCVKARNEAVECRNDSISEAKALQAQLRESESLLRAEREKQKGGDE